jgi:hypothetical protein
MAEDDHKKNPSKHRRTTIKVEHFRKIAKISDSFGKYLQVTYGGFTSSEVALQEKIRADS